MTTTMPAQPQPAAVTKEAPRCDRCGARAVAVTHHEAADLGWCRHHLREHASNLESAGIHVQLLRHAA